MGRSISTDRRSAARPRGSAQRERRRSSAATPCWAAFPSRWMATLSWSPPFRVQNRTPHPANLQEIFHCQRVRQDLLVGSNQEEKGGGFRVRGAERNFLPARANKDPWNDQPAERTKRARRMLIVDGLVQLDEVPVGWPGRRSAAPRHRSINRKARSERLVLVLERNMDSTTDERVIHVRQAYMHSVYRARRLRLVLSPGRE